MTSYSCVANPDRDIIDLLKHEKFQFELFELSMCTEEILTILQKDTTYYRHWKKRMERVNDRRLSDYDRYVHSVELNFFIKQCQRLKPHYESGYSFIEKSIPTLNAKEYTDLSIPFYNYIHYPEDIDPASLIVLVCFPEKALDDITKDKKSFSRFNDWIEYGYDEFRDGMARNNVAKEKINNRLIDFIVDRHSKSSQSLAVNSIAMLKKMKK
jgi:hypothetical protein